MSPLVKKYILGPMGLSLVMAGNLAGTFFYSAGSKVAAKAIFESDTVKSDVGQVNRLLLVRASWKYSGSSGCADFAYVVLGVESTTTVTVRLKKIVENNVISWGVVDIGSGLFADLNRCW